MNARAQLSAAGMFRKPGFGDNPHTGQTITPNLRRRLKDHKLMVAQKEIGDGHRDATGYRRPGSLKK